MTKIAYFEVETAPEHLCAGAWVEPPGDTPRWSKATAAPAVGTMVKVRMNGIGKAKVLRYFVEGDPGQIKWLGLIVQPVKPPAWYRKQNGKGPCHVFGAEVDY